MSKDGDLTALFLDAHQEYVDEKERLYKEQKAAFMKKFIEEVKANKKRGQVSITVDMADLSSNNLAKPWFDVMDTRRLIQDLESSGFKVVDRSWSMHINIRISWYTDN